VKEAGRVPMFLDSSQYENMTPKHSDTPPEYDGQPINGNDDEMHICCINRHNEHINGVFLDFSVRRLGLKQLWRLKWHRNFDTLAPSPNWAIEAPWMAHMKEY